MARRIVSSAISHLLGRSRKDVVRDAVHAFAAWRERLLDEGLDEATHRLALAGTRHEMRAAAGEVAIRGAGRVERSRIGVAWRRHSRRPSSSSVFGPRSRRRSTSSGLGIPVSRPILDATGIWPSIA